MQEEHIGVGSIEALKTLLKEYFGVLAGDMSEDCAGNNPRRFSKQDARTIFSEIL